MGKPEKDIEALIKEADAYYTHELFSEAKEIYEKALDRGSELDQEVQTAIIEKITQLEKMIEDRDQFDSHKLSTQDISMIKAGDIEETIPEIMEGASAYKELGLYKEALSEYNRLFKMGCALEKFLKNFITCLVESTPPNRILDTIDEIIQEQKLDSKTAAIMKFQLAAELERKKQLDVASDCYAAVHKIDPNYPGLDSKITKLNENRSYDSKYAYLLESKQVTPEQLKKALDLSKKNKRSVEFLLVEQHMASKEEVGKSLSLFYKCPFRQYQADLNVPVELLKNLKKVYLLKNVWVPLSWEIRGGGVVDVMIDDPKDLSKTDGVMSLLKAKKINYVVAFKEDIEQTINRFFSGSFAESEQEQASIEEEEEEYLIEDVNFEEEDDSDEEAFEEVGASSSQVVRSVDQIIISAYRKGTSDIHIEPSVKSKKVVVRYRIDGVCQEVLKLPISMATGIIARLKVMSSLDIAEKRLPQDGKIKFRRKGIRPFELRLATLPTSGGFEDAVLRILAESGAMKLDAMGLHERNLAVLKEVIEQPYGLLLVVGPTGSGKTTTLHSALSYINKPGIKIWTAEDPVEITQDGLRQVQCEHKIGLDFARVMRAFLRADPDVIMIGEMRDHETASIGIEASLTGHLVLSTLHTNSAPETITRLLDMGLNPLNFSDAFLAVMAQRLARKLCKDCKEAYHPSEEDFNEIVSIYGKESFAKTGIVYTEDLVLSRGVGCEKCSGTGYKGRLGIHELLEGTSPLKRMIKEQAPTEELFLQGEKDGMITLQQDGILKVFKGLTDIIEIRRVCTT